MKALILVDIQNDFTPGGALAVPRGDEVVGPANALVAAFPLVVATQDWHPAGHGSFASRWGRRAFELGELGGRPQVLWPDHCVQGTPGADFAPGLDTRRVEAIVRKGCDAGFDSYSGFRDDGGRPTGLAGLLRERGVEEVCVVGLATDYCVKATALDARAAGFRVTVELAACRAVGLGDDDEAGAIEEMRGAGVVLVAR